MRCLILIYVPLLLMRNGEQINAQTAGGNTQTTEASWSPAPTTTPSGIELILNTSSSLEIPDYDPCENHTDLNDTWRAAYSYNSYGYYRLGWSGYYGNFDDSALEWNGWYRLYIEGENAQLSEWCVEYITSGGYTALLIGGTHPLIKDGIVRREVYATDYYYSGYCGYYRSNPIQVKACPGNYYVYNLIRPSIPVYWPVYSTVAQGIPSYDPCEIYTTLDQPWRANDQPGMEICDYHFNWNGWYRLLHHGRNIRMSESCVDVYRCGTYYTLWLNGPHPELEDGVVTRQVCANAGYDCCYFKSPPIRVKACPGNYYVYEFVKTMYCNMAYCTDSSTISMIPTTMPNVTDVTLNTTTSPDYDPCENYSELNDIWRTTYTYYGYDYYTYGYSNYFSSHDDGSVEWNGWYRLYLQGQDAQLSEWCVGYITSGGYTPLLLQGSHPLIKDGIVTREISGVSNYYNYYNYYYYYYYYGWYNWYNGQCAYYRSNPIKVKACPGHYYVYKLEQPDLSIPLPVYAAVQSTNPSYGYDPCHDYVTLDQPWRSTNATGLGICDYGFNWNGWYRLLHDGMDVRMPESCVDVNRCGTYYTLWLNGPHPEVEDGIVTRQVCANAGYDCCFFKSPPIRVKACPGNFYVYELVKPPFCNAAYCADSNSITPTLEPPIELTLTAAPSLNLFSTPDQSAFEPCNNYNVLDDYWRSSKYSYSYNGYSSDTAHDDTLVEWDGWYRMYLQGSSAQITEWCVSYMSCGGYTPLSLGGSHPQVEDGIVTRDVYGSSGSTCTAYTSNPIQVKACPGDYYVYRFVKPDVSIPMATYCAVTINRPSYDPCDTYTSLDQPWRSTNGSGMNLCDQYFNWNGWYRLLNHGLNIRMPESCVDVYRCGTYYPLWLNGPHPEVGDGIVTRQVCGNAGYDCFYIRSLTIQVKACPGNYHVYEFVRPQYCNAAYCADVHTITPAPAPTTVATEYLSTVVSPTVYEVDPCEQYTVLEETWRTSYGKYWYDSQDDTLVNWDGWYRLFLNGKSAQLPEWCVRSFSCGGYTPLALHGTHPRISDGIVTREIYGFSNGQCHQLKSKSIQVKACPGNYYTYRLVKPDVSIPMPTYCTVAFDYPSYDPCDHYTTLDQPWRSRDAGGLSIVDSLFHWNGWYRLLHHGMNIQMAGSCVDANRCGAYYTMWLNGPHPEVEDGVVARQVCASSGYDCCNQNFLAIQLKACPGNYTVYELVNPGYYYSSHIYNWYYYYNYDYYYYYNYYYYNYYYNHDYYYSYNNYYYYDFYYYYHHSPMAYCTDPSTVTPTPAPTTQLTTAVPEADPCSSYTVLDDPWRSIHSSYSGYDDTVTDWNGWYRLYLQGASAQISEWCVSYRSCGGYTPLVLGGSHPELEDGIVTREVHAFSGSQCSSASMSHPIQVKACPGNYYVYKLVKPEVSIVMPTYCAVAFTEPSTDPCDNYQILDQPFRATNNSIYGYPYWWWWGWSWCDSYTSWHGWYRLLYQGKDIRMPESCVQEGMCGTNSPLWLSGSHPKQEDGIVGMQVCGTWSGDCCFFKSYPIQVKKCPGNYYVYEFVSPITCSLAYCEDVASIIDPESSTGAFYPFGDGDTFNEQMDDGSSPIITLLQTFNYFGKTYEQIFVNNNGHLTFDAAWYSFSPFQFPAHSGRDIIAPFWTDIDNRETGTISYQQYTSGNVLNQATKDINRYFPEVSFNATWVFVATWDKVGYFSDSRTMSSFQVVLISNGPLSFLLMNYGQIAPTTRNVQAGYDTDDSSYYFSLPGSFQYNYSSFKHSSNVNTTGRWAFRADQGLSRCQFNGEFVPHGISFWTDGSCQERCTCTRKGLVCSLEPCTYSQACRPAALQYSCQNVQRQTCTISGDPHYYTFDNQIFHFQGTATYVLSEACGVGLPYYRIEGSNEHRGSSHVSWTRLVRVIVYGTEVELVKDHPYEAMVNGTFAVTPFSLHNGSIQVYTSGFTVVVSTAFGLLVTYDAYSYVTINVPYDYLNSTCGLCGNFNYHPEDDFRTPSGQVVSSDVEFANSWNTEGEHVSPSVCSGLDCIDCTEEQKNLYRNSDSCGILTDTSGPFSACQATLSPQVFLENCVYDLCVGGGYQPILCQALNVYASQCQQQSAYIGPWRRPGFCEIPCPANSHFETQGTGCPATCSDPSAPSNCPMPFQESCICDEGYVLSAGECVPQSSCGCTFEGLYYTNGRSVILGGDCSRQCTCNNMVMSCQYHQCGEQEVCAVHNGVRGCRPTSYSTCLVEGLGTYHTYDGLTFSYPGACELVLSRVMGLSLLPNFAVSVQKVPRGISDFSRLLRFEAEGTQILIEMEERGKTKVNGQMVDLPISINSGRILIYHSSVKGIIIETSFGLTVRADWSNIIRITAPSNYNGTLAGLCGNFNTDPNDEFYSPSGDLLNNAQEFGDSWRDGSLSAYCVDSEDIWNEGYYSNSQFNELCSIMASSDGPFAQCHSQMNPQDWITDCIGDLQQTGGAREAFCEALRAYAVLCQQNGIAVGEWRNTTNCEFPCPANSHYEACGTSCPAACPSLSFPFLCTQNCQEGCQCDDGFLLSGDQCVPPTGCGCLHEGRYRQGGEQFWSDNQCQSRCVCNGTTGYVSCSSASCSKQEVCGVVDGEYGCHPRPSATCSASGDPHYTSFDGLLFDFQGTCRYTLAAVCNDTQGLPQFEVVGRNAPWLGQPASITVEVSVNVSGHLVEVSQNIYGTAEIDGETRNLPALLDSGSVSVYSSGPNTFITTDFGLSVTYDGSYVVTVTVPAKYSGTTCGLCGNFNGDSSDDFRVRSGAVVTSVSEFGADWKVQNDITCSDGEEPRSCQDQSLAQSQCEIIRDSQGPFSLCHGHVDPQPYFDNCVFDLCLSENKNNVKCDSVQSYAMACQSANARIYPWRDGAACTMSCPENSHYELCGTDCGRTCASSVDAICERTCTEGCHCDEGFVRSGGLCVSVEECGCLYNGFYFHIGESFWTEGCSLQCECFAPNDLRCVSTSCTPTQECVVRGGRLGCYTQMSTCMVTGDPHYYTYDGAVAHFQGTCSYEVSKTCGTMLANGLEFRVVATNMHRGSTAVSFVSVVEVWLTQYGEQTHVTIGQNRRVKIDGTSVEAFPADVGHLAELYREQNFVVLNASSELMVYFDGSMTLLVRLSPSFRGSVCGMCGNYNGDSADDKSMSDGAPAPDDTTFGNSWKSNTSSPGCGATDQTADPDACPFKQEHSEVCSIISNTSGPFRHCHVHINPEPYFTSCVYDLCSYSGSDMLCSAVETYETACTMIDLQVSDWRSDLACSREDPCQNLKCTEDEWCGDRDGTYGCFCNENHPRPRPETFDSHETCESSTGSMSLSRCQLFEAGFSLQNLHLRDSSCRATLQDSRVVFHFDNDANICGTNLRANGTHFVYNNTIVGEVSEADNAINRNHKLQLSFSCIYQLSQTITMDSNFNPLASLVSGTLPDQEGMYHIRMMSYEDAGFTRAYNGSVSLAVGQEVFVAVSVHGVDERQISTVMDSCWATPEINENHAVSWNLIADRCPNKKDNTVKMIENGVSTTGKFSFKMFIFSGDYKKVYLHCRIHLCLLQDNNCVPHCYPGHHRRVARSTDIQDLVGISMGPFIWSS